MAAHVAGRIARIDHQPGVFDDPIPVVHRMVGDHDDRVLGGQQVGRQVAARPPQVRVAAHHGQFGNVWIMVGYRRSFLLQQVHQLERRRLARVVHVLLVGHAQQQHPAALDRLAAVVERVAEATHRRRPASPC